MHAALLQLGWLGRKLAGAAAIVALALAGYGLWLWVQHEGRLEQQRVQRLQQAVADRDRLQAAYAPRWSSGWPALHARGERGAARVQRRRKCWRRCGSWRAGGIACGAILRSRRPTPEQAKRMAEVEQAARSRLGDELQRGRAGAGGTGWLGAGVGPDQCQEVGRTGGRPLARPCTTSRWPGKRPEMVPRRGAGGFFFGPTLWAAALYFAVAPVMARGDAIRLGPDPAALPEMGDSRVSVEAALRPGEVLRHEGAFPAGLRRGGGQAHALRPRLAIPFTSLACGLVELVELRAPGPEGDGA
jgi:hypothetical protein